MEGCVAKRMQMEYHESMAISIGCASVKDKSIVTDKIKGEGTGWKRHGKLRC